MKLWSSGCLNLLRIIWILHANPVLVYSTRGNQIQGAHDNWCVKLPEFGDFIRLSFLRRLLIISLKCQLSWEPSAVQRPTLVESFQPFIRLSNFSTIKELLFSCLSLTCRLVTGFRLNLNELSLQKIIKMKNWTKTRNAFKIYISTQ